MADKTNIEWTDSTFNPWWGCDPVSPGCDNCYAKALDRRTGGNYWDPYVDPRTMAESNWKKPLRWQRKAESFINEHGHNQRIFCGSMCDVFDNSAPEGQRNRLWDVIKSTDQLHWQLLTKRAPNIKRFLPVDWGNGYPNVWLGVTVENKKHGLPRIDILRDTPAFIRFLSVEPLLEDIGTIDLSGIDWVIIGGESGPGARPLQRFWVDSFIRQCREQAVPVFFKQWGAIIGKGGCVINGTTIKEWPRKSTVVSRDLQELTDDV